MRGYYGSSTSVGANGGSAPTIVTSAQLAAAASLKPSILGVPARNYAQENVSPDQRQYLENSANARLTDIVNNLAPSRPGSRRTDQGQYPVRGFAATREDIILLATRFLAAVRGGGYKLFTEKSSIYGKEVTGVTPLAVAYDAVQRALRLAQDAYWSAEEAKDAMAALGELALAMDEQGLIDRTAQVRGDQPWMIGATPQMVARYQSPSASLPHPPLSQVTQDKGTYFTPHQIVLCPGDPLQGLPRHQGGRCYQGSFTDLFGQQSQGGLFTGAVLELGTPYYLVSASRMLQPTPTSYAWKWMGSGWSYLGEIPAFRLMLPMR